ncbi:CBS domain-containing protein CBSX3, mitochondrial-like isoform X2 [Juglans regia]|nr:CBS domain-containing protein CBSX3, mitochondrial-like isoform X2 [Juglans regia]
MQGLVRAVRSCQETIKDANLQHVHGGASDLGKIFSRFRRVTFSRSSPEQLKGLENVTVAEVLMTKGGEKTGSWLWCHTDDAVIDAVKNMAVHDIGSLVVVKPGEKHLTGIVTERDYSRKIIAPGRSPIYTRVDEIMTAKDKVLTVTSDTNILQAMQLMTDNRIRHIPVVDGRIVGMISIVDVVRAVVEQQSGELKQLNQFIRGDY